MDTPHRYLLCSAFYGAAAVGVGLQYSAPGLALAVFTIGMAHFIATNK